MRRTIPVVPTVVFCGFLGLTLWRVVFQGLLERPSFEAPHLDAGAGDWGLIVQFLVAVIAFFFIALWVLIEPRLTGKSIALVQALLIPALFVFTAIGMQRFGPGYSDEVFQQLVDSHSAGSVLQPADIISALGEPLISGKLSDGRQLWLYSYMPSCGFGWEKKCVYLNRAGRVSQIFTMTEP